MMNHRKLDLLCMGRCAVDLYSEQIYASIEETHTFVKYVGGCPANIAIGAARLGLKTGMLSRVGDEAMGRFVKKTFIEEQVDVTHLKTDHERLTGLVFLGISPPDRFPLLFFRENCADMAIEENDFNKETFENTHSLLITGTHCSTEHVFSVTMAAVKSAVEAGTKIILDIDYRPVLWGVTAKGDGEQRYVKNSLFARRLSALFPVCDLIVGTEEEIFAATHAENIDEAIANIRQSSAAVIVQKRGHLGCTVYSKSAEHPIYGEPFHVEVLNVLGAGDAFLSGFLKGYLNNYPLEECCRLGNANGALVVTRHGCSPAMPYLEELIAFINNPRNISEVNFLHRAFERKRHDQFYFFLAFDHRIHFIKLAEKHHVPEKAIEDFKSVIYDAMSEFNLSEYPLFKFGVIVDDKYGTGVIRKINSDNFLIAKPIEYANSFPLHFIDKREASDILRTWPKHMIVKVLVYVKPDVTEVDHYQINTLKRLSDAAEIAGHQLMIELVYFGKCDHLRSILNMIESCYKSKIYPAWWKLPPIPDDESWRSLTIQIEKNDPKMCGVLLLGSHISIGELPGKFERISRCCPKITGYAVGRSIWDQTAEKWFKGEIDDAEAKKLIKNEFQFLINSRQSRCAYAGNRNIESPELSGSVRQ